MISKLFLERDIYILDIFLGLLENNIVQQYLSLLSRYYQFTHANMAKTMSFINGSPNPYCS